MRGHLSRFSRRGLLRGFSATAALRLCGQVAPETDILARLKQGHPRLILLDADIDRIKLLIKDNLLAKRLFLDLEKEAEKLQTTLPVEYKLNGPRLLMQSRRAVERVGTLSLLFRLTGKEHYLHRAVLELKAAANFKDWNPAHFPDVAEMTHAFALGYDWLFPALAFEERAWIAGALVNKGIDPALAAFQNKANWTSTRYNWNLVCNSGITLGALAVAEDFAPKAAAVLRNTLEAIPKAMSTWGTDGGWPEGPAYGDLAARDASILFAALESAMGTDLGLASVSKGFDRSGRFRVYMNGPIGKVFNYGDSAEELGPTPQLQWQAKRFNNPVLAWQEQRTAERGLRTDFYDLAWFARDARPPQAPQWPLDTVFSATAVATFRSSWDDPNGIYLAVKGGDNKAPHTHFDLGSFVLDAGGVRFASDLGPDDAVSLIPPGRIRPSFYRARTEVHNTLLIDGENQDGSAEARISHQEFGTELSWAQFDLSKANGAKTKVWQRRVGLAQRQAVLLEDVVESDKPLEVVWGMITDAEITLSGQSAVLQKGKWSMAAEIRSPRHAVFDIVSVRAASQTGTYKKLIVRIGEKVSDLRLTVLFTPYRTGATKPKIAVQFPV